MRVVIVGGGFAGLLLARALGRRGVAAPVIERGSATRTIPGPIMLPFQAFDPLEDVGLLEGIRAAGRDIAPGPDGMPVAIAVRRQVILEALLEGADVAHDHEVVDLMRTGARVTGVRVRSPSGERELPADLVVGADGVRSGVRSLAGFEAELRDVPGATLSFRSPVESDVPFAMRYLADGRQVGLLGYPGGSAGWWQIEGVGRDAALAPGVDAFLAAFARLLPEAAPSLAGVRGEDQLIYRTVTEVRCATWWRPGVALIGEAAHAIDPETGIGSGLGMGDALALAVAVASAGDDPDRAASEYERWRRPAVAPYEAVGAEGTRLARGGPLPDEERWPPRDTPLA